MSTREAVIKITKEQLGIKDEISDSDSFVDDLGADSLDTIELVMACEEEFHIEIADEEAEQVNTIADAVKLIENYLNTQ
jgi:acyl carrier protein